MKMLRELPPKRHEIMIHGNTPGNMDGESLSEEGGRGEEGKRGGIVIRHW